MSEETNELSRRKRIRLYKRIIVILIVAVILLPTILCVILFCRMSGMQKEIQNLRLAMDIRYHPDNTAGDDFPEETPAISDNTGTPNKADSLTHKEPVTPPAEPLDPDQAGKENPPAPNGAEGETSSADGAKEETTAEAAKPSGQQKLVEEALAEGRKVVYLTFDDGPSANTEKLLDALDGLGVKATFFINGHTGYEEQLKRIVREGHTLAMHTYTHDYEHVYRNLDTFGEEIDMLSQYIYDVTGITPRLFRFPGGSSNSKAKLPISTYIEYLDEKELVYYDWNVSSGDGSDGLTAAQVYDNVMSGVAGQEISIVLMHDSTHKMSTYEAIPRIIESLQAMDALILPIAYDTTPVHHNVN